MFALVWMHFEVNFHISKSFGFSNIKRRYNGTTSFGPVVFDIDFNTCLFMVIGRNLSVILSGLLKISLMLSSEICLRHLRITLSWILWILACSRLLDFFAASITCNLKSSVNACRLSLGEGPLLSRSNSSLARTNKYKIIAYISMEQTRLKSFSASKTTRRLTKQTMV